MHYRVLGWYGRGNCGDDAFVHAFRKLLAGCNLSFQRPAAGPIHQRDAECLILGGGDVVKTYYLDCVPLQLPLAVIGCGLGYESEIELLRERRIQYAVFRNRSDVAIAANAGIPAAYAPDICFSLD